MSWFSEYLGAPSSGDPTPPPAQADATAAPRGTPQPQPTIGPSNLTPSQFAALAPASVPSVPQGLQAVVQNLMNPSSRLGQAAGFVVPGLSAAQAGRTSAQLVNNGHPIRAALTAIPALLPPELGGGALLRRIAGEAESAAPAFLSHTAINDVDHEAQYAIPATGDVAFVRYHVQPDGTARVGFMGSTGGPGSLGAGSARAILRDLQQRLGASGMSGNRISGANPGHEMTGLFSH